MSNEIIPAPQVQPPAKQNGVDEQTMKITTALIGIVQTAVNTQAEINLIGAKTDAYAEKVKQDILLLDAEARSYIERVQADLQKARSKADVLIYLVGEVEKLKDAPPYVLEGINGAIINISHSFRGYDG